MDQASLRELQQLDAATTCIRSMTTRALAKRGTRILTRGEGCYVWDGEGNKLLDAFAGLWCVNVGYGRKELGAAAPNR
jgi:putrescine aminotransferase